LTVGLSGRAVDPLDGTTNFSHSYPCFAVSVGGAPQRCARPACRPPAQAARLAPALRADGLASRPAALPRAPHAEKAHAMRACRPAGPCRSLARVVSHVACSYQPAN